MQEKVQTTPTNQQMVQNTRKFGYTNKGLEPAIFYKPVQALTHSGTILKVSTYQILEYVDD